jgi:hypothetical protein
MVHLTVEFVQRKVVEPERSGVPLVLRGLGRLFHFVRGVPA